MANIRFVKPPGDNRVRQFPKAAFQEDVIHITTPVPRDVIHIITPKPISRPVPPWDIFIAAANESSRQSKMSASSSQSRGVVKHDRNNNGKAKSHIDRSRSENGSNQRTPHLQKCFSNSLASTSKNGNKKCEELNKILSSSSSSSLSSSNEAQTATSLEHLDKNDNSLGSTGEKYHRRGSGAHDNGITQASLPVANKGDNETPHRDVSDMEPAEKKEEEEEKEENKQNCPIVKMQEDIIPHPEDNKPDDVVENLPEVFLNENASTPTQTQIPQLPQQHHHHHQKQQQQQQNHNKQEPEPPCKATPHYKYLEHAKPIQRSVSDISLSESNRAPSFFRSVNNTRYEFDEKKSFDPECTSFAAGVRRGLSQINSRRKTDEAVRNADGGGCGKVSGFKASENSGSGHGRRGDDDKSLLLKRISSESLHQHDRPGAMTRSVSRDSLPANRLLMRRFALADPEKMMMSQTLREKLERDVERRKASVIRKVSQFFNVQLGLNKEEDLI